MNGFTRWVFIGTMLALPVGTSLADVFNMGGTRNPDGSWNGLASLETVPVGNTGNVGEVSGYPGAERTCGAVPYTYSMGKFEVTYAQYTEFLNAVAATDTYALYNGNMNVVQRSGTSGSYTYSVAADWANRPLQVVSWGSAVRFANWLNNGQPTGPQDLNTTEDGAYYLNGANDSDLLWVRRKENAKWAIPTEDEWYKAAYHKNDGATGSYWDYPTSTDNVPSGILVNPDPGNNSTYRSNGWTIGAPYYVTEVGAHENSESPYGTFDQGGNVSEWTESAIYGYQRGVRGGSYYDTVLQLARDRVGRYTNDISYQVGFRVAQVPEPTTLTLLAMAGLLAARRKRR